MAVIGGYDPIQTLTISNILWVLILVLFSFFEWWEKRNSTKERKGQKKSPCLPGAGRLAPCARWD